MKQRLIRLFKATLLLASAVAFSYRLGILAYKWLCDVRFLSHTLERIRNGAYQSYTTTFLYLLYAVDALLIIYLLVKLGQFVWRGEEAKQLQSRERHSVRGVVHHKVGFDKPKWFSMLLLSRKPF